MTRWTLACLGLYLVLSTPTGVVAAAAAIYERRLDVADRGPVSVRIGAHIYDTARFDLGDLRVIDSEGRDVAYWLKRGERSPQREPWQPAIRNRSFETGQNARVTLDLGTRITKSAVALSLSGDSFRRRVSVEASDDGDTWRMIQAGAWVFAVPEPPTRFETVSFPENDERYLRVTVHNAPDDPARIRIRAARVWRVAPPRTESFLEPRTDVYQAEELRETHVLLDLAARHQPFEAVLLDVADPHFFRRVTVEARLDPLPRRGEHTESPFWVEIGSGSIHRVEAGEAGAERLRVEVSGRARVLRLRISNGDDRPLSVSRARLATPIEHVVFRAVPGETYRVRYGDHTLQAPVYDLERSVGGPDEWAASALQVGLGPPVLVPGPAPEPLPWSERHPALLWAGLVGAVAALGFLTWRALSLQSGIT
jgi:hypothetical protein